MSFSRLLYVSLCSFTLTTFAQLGVAPSQTSQFLDELRERHGVESKDSLTEDRAALERGRDLSRPDILSASQAASVRLSGDLTSYAGHYQAGRTYLSPFSLGVEAPERRLTGPWGLEWGAALEQTVEYNHVEVEQPVFPFNFDSQQDSLVSQTFLYLDGEAGSLDEGRLTFGLGLGMTYATTNDLMLEDGSGNWAGQVRPGTSIAYDVHLGPVAVTIYDRVSIRSSSAVSAPRWLSAGSFGTWQNDAGVAAAWQVDEDWSAILNYNWAVSRAQNKWFASYGNRTVKSISTQVAYAGCAFGTLGLEGGYGWSDGEAATHDGQQWHAGLYLQTERVAGHTLRVAAGYQSMEFETLPLIWVGLPPFFTTFLTTGDNSSVRKPYYRVAISGALSDRVSHELEFGYESSLSLVANAISAHFVNYGVTVKLWEGALVAASAYLEAAEDSGGVFARHYTQFGADVAFEQKVGQRWRFGAGYHFGHTDAPVADLLLFFPPSPIADVAYDQHGVGANCRYEISKDCAVWVAVQSFVLYGNAAVFDQRQDRAMVGMRVNF